MPILLFCVDSNLRCSAAAAKSLQSWPTLCEPIDGSPPGSAIPGILQARTLEWVAISFPNAWRWKVKVKSLSRARLSVTPWTAAHQAPPSLGFSRQEHWSSKHVHWAVVKTAKYKEQISDQPVRLVRRLLKKALGSPAGSVVKNPPAKQEIWVQSLGWEDPLEKEMVIHSSILAWEIPRTEDPGRPQSRGSQRLRQDSNWSTTSSQQSHSHRTGRGAELNTGSNLYCTFLIITPYKLT